jgi:hypothetical protein
MVGWKISVAMEGGGRMFHGMTQQAAQRESNLTSYTSIHSSKRHNFAVLGLVETLHLEICVMHLVDH